MDLTSRPDEVKELVRAQLEAGHFQSVDEVRSQIAEGVAAEKRGELRDGAEAIADVRRRVDERLRAGDRGPERTRLAPASARTR